MTGKNVSEMMARELMGSGMPSTPSEKQLAELRRHMGNE
jgi:hypothetical protein